MSEIQPLTSSGGSGSSTTGAAGDARAAALAGDHQVSYVAGEHRFEVMLDGKPTTISPLEAVCLVLQNRYLALSDSTAQKTRAMQDQVNEISEANDWLNALRAARGDGTFTKPSDTKSASLAAWMKNNGLEDGIAPDAADSTLDSLEAKFSSRVDQLSSTNELKMLELKTTVNKSQEALTAADGLLQDLKQLVQTITNNMGR